MIRVYYSLEGQSFGRDFTSLGEALAFAEDNPDNTTVVASDGIHLIRRFTFQHGMLTGYDVARHGRMVDLLNKENAA